MKKFLIKNWWISIPILPFILMALLHISIALGNYFSIDINIPNIYASDWFMFFGSYLGGSVTLLGVILTIRHSRQLHQHQISIGYLQKEEENVAEVLASLPVNQTLNIMGVYATGFRISDDDEINNIENSKETIREIYLCQTSLTQAKIKLAALSFILQDYNNCSSCKNKCNLNEIAPKFRATYEELESTIDKCLEYIYETIRARDNSLMYSSMLKENMECAKKEEQPLYSQERLDNLQKSHRDRIDIFKDFKAQNDELLKLRESSMPELISLSKQYFMIRKENCYKKCFEDWKGGQH